MPTAARGECLAGVAEIIDGTTPIKPDAFGEEASLQLRTSNLHRMSRMGPPDVAYFRKRFRPVMGASTVHGYYHFVRGVDVGSAASITAYLIDLVNNGLDALPWVSTGTWEIIGATYRTFNAISNVDVVVDLKIPGCVSAHAVGTDGVKTPLTDSMWKETAVCAAIRDLTSTGEHPLYPCLRVMHTQFERMEEEFLDNARACVPSWQNLPPIATSDGPAPSTSKVAMAISEHFLSFCRYDRSISFFEAEEVYSACTDALVHVAAAHRLKKNLAAAEEAIGRAISANENSSLAWTGKAKIHAARGELEDAHAMATRACAADGADIATYVVLADLCADLHRYPEALMALNNGNMPQLELDYYLRELVLKRRSKTSPASGAANGCDAISKLALRLKKERNVFNSKCDDNLSELPGHMMTTTEHDCYSVLVKILSDVGWDRLLAIRGEAFVMETDIESKNAAAAKAAAARAASAAAEKAADDAEKPAEDGKEGAQAEKDGADVPVVEEEAEGDAAEKDEAEGGAKPNGKDVEAGEGNAGDLGDPAESENRAPVENSSAPPTPALEKGENGPAPDEPGTTIELQTSAEKLKNVSISDGAADEPSESADAKPNGRAEAEGSKSAEDAEKVVCKPWLDYLVTVMYEDLRAMAVWNAEERTHVSKSSKGSGNGVSRSPSISPAASKAESTDDLEAGKQLDKPKRSPAEVASTTKRHAADWLRRGELALRLQKVEEAKTAFQTCIKLSDKAKAPSIAAHLNLMNLSAREGDAVTTIKCADVIWSYLDSVCDRKSSSKSTPPVRVIQRAIFNLTAKLGLRSVREILANLDVDRHRIGTVLLDAVAWSVHGYSS